ncbi:hypothetical protein BCR33DRAFT_734882 [Rhizoclosmatium globosum]|uniref:Transcription factor domain-containing protein n=1 Tax=Rhizoclosmatium globosum TaxID=329046 RepID=A0A1Y2CQV3_9FUNG|nr:hypothetical protein BCR33DRAFT_734882 [Rhizoclosmatium globosum]|eukprot:ORY49392.1 hypothetical protein BCR33DRAFT_734882 [Rhizoclosmatium globosum]
MAAMNVNAFILTFFTQPAPLRLVIGAIAAYYSSPIISESDALWFFKRARKAVILASDRPTFSSIQAYFWIHLYAGIMKKEELGLPFLKMAIDFAVISKVDVDPDFQPQLAHMNEIQKEERRRIFWSVCFISRVVLSVRSDYALSMLQLDQMKPLQPIIGVFEGMRSCKPVCEVRGFIIAIKRHYDSVPSSIQKILYCSNLQNLHIQFVILLSNIPPSLVLPFDNQLEIMSILLSNTEPVDIHVPSLNLDILACTTLLYRSQLYLSALNKFHPSILAPSTQDIVITAIEQCIIAVKRAKSLVQVLYDMNDINISAHSRFWYPLFELSIVSWFIVCRMDKAWSEFVPIEVSELVAASELFADLAIKSMNELDISLPISTALTIMMQEMKVSVDQGQNIRPSASTGTALSNKWEVGLDGSYFGYLGLMGLEVGGMAWKGKNEAEWKQFWKQNGIKQ